jgi:hypothetical protein
VSSQLRFLANTNGRQYEKSESAAGLNRRELKTEILGAE